VKQLVNAIRNVSRETAVLSLAGTILQKSQFKKMNLIVSRETLPVVTVQAFGQHIAESSLQNLSKGTFSPPCFT
jgi:hypothetical protein